MALIKSPKFYADLGMSPVTGWRWVKAGYLPPPIKYLPNSGHYQESERDAIQQALVRGASKDELKELATKLMEARKGNVAA